MKFSLTRTLILGPLLLGVGCASIGARPLSIKLHHPQTNVSLDCAARDLGSANYEMLADTVEICARQLEARGFVRSN